MQGRGISEHGQVIFVELQNVESIWVMDATFHIHSKQDCDYAIDVIKQIKEAYPSDKKTE